MKEEFEEARVSMSILARQGGLIIRSQLRRKVPTVLLQICHKCIKERHFKSTCLQKHED